MIRPRNLSITPPRFDGLASPAPIELGVRVAVADEPLDERVPRVRRIADREPLERLRAQSALGEVGARALRLGCLEQDLAIPRDRRLERVPQALPLAVFPSGPLRELDAGLLGQSLERLAEIEAVPAHQEGEDVTALTTAEAAPRLAVGADDERRRLLRVEGAEPLVGGAGALQCDRLADDLEHAELRFDLGGDARRAHPEARIPFDGLVVK